MFASAFTIATVALAALSSVVAVPMPNHGHAALSSRKANWPSKFEDYDVYHARYNALDCRDKHNTKFFTTCCGPLLKGKKLSSRPDECNPDKNNDDDCDEEPTTTKSATPTPKPTTTKKTSTTKAATTTKSSGGGGSTNTGVATFFFQNGAAGACGKKNPDSLPLVALTSHFYGSFSRKSSNCGRHILITNTKNGKSVKAIVADACPTCGKPNNIDLSTGAYDKLGSRADGVLPVKWAFTD